MKSAEWERALAEALTRAERHGLATGGRYGVQARRTKDGWQVVPSLPDFEGVLAGGRQFVFDAKVVSVASLELRSSHFADRQYKHLVERATFGAICGLAVLFNERRLKRRHDGAMAYWIPVDPTMPLWVEFADGDRKSIDRETARRSGWPIYFRCGPGERKHLPDIIGAIRGAVV